MTTRQQLGAFGERVAAARLEADGMTIIARNVRVPGGEIDIIARDGEDIVFIEVRTRRAIPGVAAESLVPAKLQRMWRCAMAYCEREAIDPTRARVDVASLDLDARGRLVAFQHYRAIEVPDE